MKLAETEACLRATGWELATSGGFTKARPGGDYAVELPLRAEFRGYERRM